MKKNIRLIIIICAAAVLLGGAVLALVLTAPKEETEEADDTPATSLLYDKTPEDLAKLTVENEDGSYELIRVGEGDNAAWTVEEFISFPLDSSLITKLIDNSSSLTAQQTVVENPEDISIYGLDAPAATVTANFSDSAGTVKKIIIGNLTPEETKRYIMIDGDSNVYTVYNSAVTCFLEDKFALINKTIYTAKTASDEDDTTDYTKIKKMTIKRADLDYDVVIEYDTRLDDSDAVVGNSSSYVMSEPIFRDLNPETSATITDTIFGFTASDVAVLNPADSDLELLGITNPAAEITIEVNGGDVISFKIGDEFVNDDGVKEGRFVMVDGINVVYIFDTDDLPWLTFKPLDIVTSMYTSNYVYDLDTLDITCGGRTLSFDISGTDSDDFSVKLNGEDTDSERFKTLYQYILKAPSTELCFDEPDGEPDLTVNIKTKQGKTDLIEFIPVGGRQSAVRLNGEPVYICAQAYVDRFISNIELYENGEEIISNW